MLDIFNNFSLDEYWWNDQIGFLNDWIAMSREHGEFEYLSWF